MVVELWDEQRLASWSRISGFPHWPWLVDGGMLLELGGGNVVDRNKVEKEEF